MTLDNKDITIYLAQKKLAEWAGLITTAGVRSSRIYQHKAEKLRYYLKAIQYSDYLTDAENIALLTCIEKLAEITDWPTAPTLIEQTPPAILMGIPGTNGSDGAAGAAGSDANIDVIGDTDYDNMSVIETTVSGVKTYKIGYAPYTEPTIVLSLTKTSFPNPNKLVQELGEVIGSVPLVITVNKGREDAVSSAMINPTALDTAYQLALDLVALNAGTEQVIGVADTNVSTNTIYSANVIDDRSTVADSETLSFVIPFLYGSSANLLVEATYYSNLTRIIEAQGDKSVVFNDTNSYFYFIYDASYPDLTSILDGNGFEAIGAFTLTTENITMLSGIESMKVYKTILTDIPTQTYTFKF